MRGIKTEVVFERVFANRQGENTSDKICWVRTQVMHEASSPKLGKESLWIAKEKEARKWLSPRKNTI